MTAFTTQEIWVAGERKLEVSDDYSYGIQVGEIIDLGDIGLIVKCVRVEHQVLRNCVRIHCVGVE